MCAGTHNLAALLAAKSQSISVTAREGFRSISKSLTTGTYLYPAEKTWKKELRKKEVASAGRGWTRENHANGEGDMSLTNMCSGSTAENRV